MPLYTVSSSQTLSPSERQQIANDITDIHCMLTGAPAIFVQVVFAFNVPLKRTQPIHVLGSIRAGRSAEVKHQLHQDIATRIARTLDLTAEQVETVLLDVPASWVIEGGEVMPEPGQEAEWLAKVSL